MTGVDGQFIKDLDDCLKAADQLAIVDTEDARLFVSQQLQDLHTFLQQKQRDAETRVEEDIKKEENEIENLKRRIDRATKSDGTNEGDIAYTDFGLLWTVLKEEYWQLAFNAYISETEDSVKTILDNLIAILKTSFNHCKNRAAESREKMMFQVYYPGEDAQKNRNLKQPKTDPSVESSCKKCQIKSTPFCLPSIQQALINDVKADKLVAKHFKHQSKELSKAIEKYLSKCAEFCWIASFEEPEVRLITTPIKECRTISSQFAGLDKTTHHARQDYACVEWPAVIQGEGIKIPWQLYILSQPRPQPKNMHGDTSKDYRVTGTEGRDGQFLSDTEDVNITQANVHTATETISSDNSKSKAITKDATGRQDKPTDVNERSKKDNTDGTKAVKSGDRSKSVEPKQAKPSSYKGKPKGHPNIRF